MAKDVFGNLWAASRSATSTAPASGTVETWTGMTTQVGTVPVFASGAGEMRVVEDDADRQKEIILVTEVTAGGQWTVTRGAEGTTPVVHPSGANFVQTITKAMLEKIPFKDSDLFKQTTTGSTAIDGTGSALIIGGGTRPTNDSERLVVYAANGQTQGVIQARDHLGGALFNTTPKGQVWIKTGINVADTRNANDLPSSFNATNGSENIIRWDFKAVGTIGLSGESGYAGVQTFAPYGDDTGGPIYQTAYAPSGTVYIRKGTRAGGWGAWGVLGGMGILATLNWGPSDRLGAGAYRAFYWNGSPDWCNPTTHTGGSATGIYGTGNFQRNESNSGSWGGETSAAFTAPASGKVKVTIVVQSYSPAAYTQLMSFRLTGASTVNPANKIALRYGFYQYGSADSYSAVIPVSGLTPGGSYTIEPMISNDSNGTYAYFTALALIVEG